MIFPPSRLRLYGLRKTSTRIYVCISVRAQRYMYRLSGIYRGVEIPGNGCGLRESKREGVVSARVVSKIIAKGRESVWD